MSPALRTLPRTLQRQHCNPLTAVYRLSSIRAHVAPAQLISTTRTMANIASAGSIPKTMRGILIEKTGGTEVLQYKTDLPVPQPKEGEILVKNDFIGVNYIDTYFRTGLYQSPKPEILGREASGTVVAHGSKIPPPLAANLAPGKKVVWMANGGYAEYTSAPAEKTLEVPSGLSQETAAAALLQGLTALTLIREAYHVQRGDWVLVHAAAGGTGLWLCQLLKAVGANTIGTASTPEKVALAKENGATYVVNYTKESVKDKVHELTGGEGVKAVFDGVGKTTFDESLEVVARKGTLVSFGNASGAVPPVTIARLSAKNVKLTRPTLFNYVYTRDELETYAKELFDFILKDNLNDFEGRKTTGKLLLKP